MANKYINVQCSEYSLLVDIFWVEEVINVQQTVVLGSKLEWRGKTIDYVDLTQILMGHDSIQNKHSIILSDDGEYLAVAVGQVANIQQIEEEEFEDLPNLDFPFNDYFDKAYMKSKYEKCIYRLRNLVEVKAEGKLSLVE